MLDCMTELVHGGFPFGATARRRTWEALPAHIQAVIADHSRAPVVDADSMSSGFTPGFASVLTMADGSRTFVKAAGQIDDGRHGWTITD
jgi:hypothetical protein